jgi:hypothetical protein
MFLSSASLRDAVNALAGPRLDQVPSGLLMHFSLRKEKSETLFSGETPVPEHEVQERLRALLIKEARSITENKVRVKKERKLGQKSKTCWNVVEEEEKTRRVVKPMVKPVPVEKKVMKTERSVEDEAEAQAMGREWGVVQVESAGASGPGFKEYLDRVSQTSSLFLPKEMRWALSQNRSAPPSVEDAAAMIMRKSGFRQRRTRS